MALTSRFVLPLALGAALVGALPLAGCTSSSPAPSDPCTRDDWVATAGSDDAGAVDAVLSGHVHLAQVTGWTEGLPPTFVAGNSGTNLVTFPSFPNPPTPYTGSGFTPSTFEYKSEFGFMMMERTATGWSVVAYDQAGKPMTACTVLGRTVACSP